VNEDRPPVEEERPPAEAEARPPETPEEEDRDRVIEEPARRRPLPLSRLILGLVLVGVGVIWLLQALDIVSFSFLAILPAALIVVGVVLIGAARSGRHSPLIVLGVILTVILTIASGFDIRLQGGIGERTERPTVAEDLESEYHLSAGELTIDLRNVTLTPGANTRIEASVGLGQLTVRIPDDIGLAIVATGRAGAGEVALFDRESSGVNVDLSTRFPQLRPGQPVATPVYTLTLDLSVGLGQIEVSR
jgi:predicted membrane protein